MAVNAAAEPAPPARPVVVPGPDSGQSLATGRSIPGPSYQRARSTRPARRIARRARLPLRLGGPGRPSC